MRHRRAPAPERLQALFEDLGGTFLKFGQMLALQPDILPIEYCTALFNLLDRMPPATFSEVERTFQEELGTPLTEAFDWIDREPLATASIGQVHLAAKHGRKYAVKIQRRSAEFEFRCDVRLMNAAIRAIKMLRFRKLYWLIEPITEFAGWTEEELDYRNEARSMLRQRANAANNPRERIPDVLMEFTSRRTLVAEFLDGETVLSYLRLQEADPAAAARTLAANGCEANRVAANIINNFLGDVFLHGMFHADLHPANLVTLRDNVIGYVDFGITGTISRYSRNNLIALTLAYTRGDVAGMGEAFSRVSTTGKRFRPERFRKGLELLGRTWYATNGSERRLRKNFTLVMLDMARLSRQMGCVPARDVVKYIRSAVAIDGLLTRMSPEFDLGRHLEVTCAQYMKAEGQRALLGRDAMIDFVVSTLNLMSSGGQRAVGLLERAARGTVSASADGGRSAAPG
jgi:ubiquinone biosynthesis protein